jgi:hypothetical protein
MRRADRQCLFVPTSWDLSDGPLKDSAIHHSEASAEPPCDDPGRSIALGVAGHSADISRYAVSRLSRRRIQRLVTQPLLVKSS